MGIHAGAASQAYFEWWGLSLAELLGNLTPQNLSFVESRLQNLFSPNLYQQVQATLNQQFQQLRDDKVSSEHSVKPSDSLIFEHFQPYFLSSSLATVFCRTGSEADLKGRKTFTISLHAQVIRFRQNVLMYIADSSLEA